MSVDAGRELARVLKRRAGDGATIVARRMVDWGALLFEGHRHEIRLAMAAEQAACFAGEIGEAEFMLDSHIVADIVVLGSLLANGMTMVEVEALTLVDHRPCGCEDGNPASQAAHAAPMRMVPPCRDESHKGHKGHDRCGLRPPAGATARRLPPERSARG